ncbi:MFS drug transporter [Sporothrix schenckii 1099-18]|uniref:Major facilitator superfamily (MFS) profile domain-containing protein n=2 Tax=Sporothrix schenckii TaxID=29908 RepID=U7PRP0_SPOS1|nr:MFS drug transporter [Sporothrix schenckii 1099-18]ERS97606.1 hypothetical protein HMPREF1624_05777 [Sporothrix schenckii ATCC 58251]KJR82128.1 MFS drug transporter [Sporothrix schenckii 1099-18]
MARRDIPRHNGDANTSSDAVAQHDETSPLLAAAQPVHGNVPPGAKAVPGLFWIEAALFTNVFLAGFDGTVTASTYAVITSEFQSANLAAWISTSYLVTTTALQPLYGRLSDIVGRRACLLAATLLFGLGCLGCALSPNLGLLIAMRALAGAGGGGLMTMATIINTDLIAPEQRGMYQAGQNILHGVGAILGASLGGTLAGWLGWRFAFLVQVPICLAALVVARVVVPKSIVPRRHRAIVKPDVDGDGDGIDADVESVVGGNAREPSTATATVTRPMSTWEQVDFLGAVLLIAGLSLFLAALSAGSNNGGAGAGAALAWAQPSVLGCLGGSIVLLAVFFAVEARTTAVPLLPLSMLHGVERVSLLVANVCLGMSGYGFLFLMPLFFQAVLLDSAAVAGLRLVASSLATPLGGLTTGLAMKFLAPRYAASGPNALLTALARGGALVLLAGGVANLALGMHDPSWHYAAYLTVGGFGQGMSYPASLFRFIGACDFGEHAVATYLVYLVRSVGSVAGVAAISTIVQTHLLARLTDVFAGTPGGAELIDTLTHSVEALRDLPADTRVVVQGIYYEACRRGLYFLLAVGSVTVVCTLLLSTKPRK